MLLAHAGRPGGRAAPRSPAEGALPDLDRDFSAAHLRLHAVRRAGASRTGVHPLADDAGIPIRLSLDSLSRFFLGLVAVMWLLAGFYSFEYMEHEEEEHRFHAFFLLTQGVLSGLTMAENLVTFYLFYEAMTLITLPLVLHTRTRESIAAAVKYLVYSVFGASAALLGIFYLSHACATLSFVPGGSLRDAAAPALPGIPS